MGSKSSPSAYDCFAAAEPDEPMFVLLGRDRHGPTLVWLWACLRELDGEEPAVVGDARDTCVAMIEYAAARGRKVVGLGQSVLVGVMDLIRQANQAAKEHKNDKTSVDVIRRMLATTLLEGNS